MRSISMILQIYLKERSKVTEDKDANIEQRVEFAKGYTGDRPTHTPGDTNTDETRTIRLTEAYTGERPQPTPISEEPSEGETSDNA